MKYQNHTDYWVNGEFERMYQDIDDPWGCSAHSDSFDNQVFRLMVLENLTKLSANDKKILDIGCGTGDSTYQLFSLISNPVEMTGIDTSLTAISKATEKYGSIKFENKNILFDDIDSGFDCICLSEVIWYILDDLYAVFSKLSSSLNINGVIAIKQYFPNDQKFGKEILDGLLGFENFIDSIRFNFEKTSNIIIDHGFSGKVILITLKKICH